MRLLQRLLVAPLVLCAANSAVAQGYKSYLNFETPQLKPIACTTVGSTRFVLVCNSPDNSIEIYNADNTANTDHGYLGRVPVGLEPVSIVVKPTAGEDVRRCYSVNWLGDSITAFDLHDDGSFDLLRTVHVGDEPMMIAFAETDVSEDTLLVTFSAQAAWGLFNADTIQPIATGYEHRELMDSTGAFALKDPRMIAWSPIATNKLFILNFRGGNDTSSAADGYDFDIWGTSDFAASAVAQKARLTIQGNLGTTNFNMCFAPNGDLYVVSQLARNKGNSGFDFVNATGGPVMQGFVSSETGLTRSLLHRVKHPCSTSATVESLDLNSDDTTFTGNQTSVPITQPTDVVVYGSGDDDETRVFVTGYNSDTLGVAEPTGGAFTVTPIEDFSTASAGHFSDTNKSGVMRGPRGLALLASGTPNDTSDRLFVYNRIEHSITVVDPNYTVSTSAILRTFPLKVDPTPSYIKDARKFLYSSRLSAVGNTSCASCHVDGHTDGLAWNLSDGNNVTATTPTDLPNTNLLGPNTGNKGPMQTQSLRGLVNFEVENQYHQGRLYTNAPYHWRGDRENFSAFNEAFTNLLAIAHPETGTLGLSTGQLRDYTQFVNSIHYPPNPEQPVERLYSGSVEDADGSGHHNSVGSGAGALQGLQRYHIENTDGHACVNCHSLPEGSNNRLTDGFKYIDVDDHSIHASLSAQHIETPAIRGIVNKEKQLWRLGSTAPIPLPNSTTPARTGEFGLLHTGKSTLATNSFTAVGFESTSARGFLNGFGATSTTQRDELALYVREFDTGVAPIIGQVITVDSALLSSNPTLVSNTLDLFEGQVAKANCELAVTALLAGDLHGLWYDVLQSSTKYTEIAHTGVTPLSPSVMTRSTLLGLLAGGDILTFECVPLGTGRRAAYLDGGLPADLSAITPTNVDLVGCVTNTANALVPTFTAFWESQFESFTDVSTLDTANNRTLLYYEANLVTVSLLPELRHEAPRRFAVQGRNIKQGAKLRIRFMTSTDTSSITTLNTAPTTTSASDAEPLELPIYPSREGSVITWQTAEEMEPLYLLGLMCGGYEGTAGILETTPTDVVKAVLNDSQNHAYWPIALTTTTVQTSPLTMGSGTDMMKPLRYNWYFVQIVNPGGATSTGHWERIELN